MTIHHHDIEMSLSFTRNGKALCDRYISVGECSHMKLKILYLFPLDSQFISKFFIKH